MLPDEVIVVDDGSEPPLELSERYAVPVKMVRQHNQGPRRRAITVSAKRKVNGSRCWIPMIFGFLKSWLRSGA